MNEGVNKLARVLHGRINDNREAYSDLILDFGTIQSDLSLLTNTYPISIPQSDYLVLRSLTLGETGGVLTTTAEVSGHSHNVYIPEKMRSIKAGDRVLVAWVQNDAIVLDIICPASAIG